jgi:hypothetical protein
MVELKHDLRIRGDNISRWFKKGLTGLVFAWILGALFLYIWNLETIQLTDIPSVLTVDVSVIVFILGSVLLLGYSLELTDNILDVSRKEFQRRLRT